MAYLEINYFVTLESYENGYWSPVFTNFFEGGEKKITVLINNLKNLIEKNETTRGKFAALKIRTKCNSVEVI